MIDALATLNQAQTRGALSHILKYHSEIDGLRSEAQEGQEWQRRIEAAGREAGTLADRRRFDQALEVLDNTLRPLSGRGWERLGQRLAVLRDRLWAERDVTERIQFAQATYERQDYRLATELAANLHEELPEREDVRRLHERARAAWTHVADQLAAVEEALTHDRAGDALALLGALRSEHPHNPDWQAIALRVQTKQGREDTATGRAAMIEHAFEDAAEAFERAHAAFTATVEIFPDHPTAPAEQTEAEALRDAALFASQAVRDRLAFRWEASRQGWRASREQLSRGAAARGRDFGEVVAVLDAMLGEAQAALTDLDQARLMLAEGREYLDARNPGHARESFRAGLARVEGGRWGDASEASQLREHLAAGLREAERSQREVKKALGQAGAAKGEERLALLRRAYERWETAPGLAARLSDELLASAEASVEANDEDGALDLCEQVRELSEVPAGALAAAEGIAAAIRARRQVRAGLADAAAAMEATARTYLPSPEGFSQALAIMDRLKPALEDAKELTREFNALRTLAEDGLQRSLAAKRHATESEALAAAGDWPGAAEALAPAIAVLGPPAREELGGRLKQLREWAETIQNGLVPASDDLRQAETLYAMAADGDLAAIDWDALERLLAEVRKRLRPSPELPATLPPAWEETRARAETLARRSQVLRGVHKSIAAGRGVDAIPALQAEAAVSSDPVLLAVLTRLLQETAGDAAVVARGWLAETSAALNRGELASAEASLALAQSYVAAAPQVIPEIRRTERQVASLAQIRGATVEARTRSAAGDLDAALACYRRAIEEATDGDAGLPADIRRALNQLLDLEDELAGPPSGAQHEGGAPLLRGAALLEALLAGSLSEPLALEFVAPAVSRWWKLACRAARLAGLEAQVSLGRDGVALEAAAALVEAYPRDRAGLELYKAARERTQERVLARMRRRLRRAQMLAAGSAFAEAMAEISPEAMALGDDVAVVSALGAAEAAEALAIEAAGVRMGLSALQAIADRLSPLLEEMRESCLAGDFEGALEAWARAEFVDPRRRTSMIWAELDALTALAAQRQEGRGPVEGPPSKRSAQTSEVSTLTPGQATSEVSSRDTATPASQASKNAEVSPRNAAAQPAQASTTAEAAPRDISTQTPEVSTLTPGQATAEVSPPEAPSHAPEVTAPVEPDPSEEPGDPPAPFDLDDWLSNVTELSPDDGDI